MSKFGIALKNFREENKITEDKIVEILEIDKSTLNKIESGEFEPSKQEIKVYTEKLGMKYMSTGKRIIKSLDLIFRLGSFVMAIVTLLLCISQNISDKTLIVLLAISMMCNAMIMLPKIDK
jgi:transcriptional regulator with XRE-family HTH domain